MADMEKATPQLVLGSAFDVNFAIDSPYGIRVGCGEIRRNHMAPAAARIALESLLRDRKLDTTLTTAAPLEWTGGDECAPTGLLPLDAQLRGGVPRGQVSEIVGP